jgi:hypothetical protein
MLKILSYCSPHQTYLLRPEDASRFVSRFDEFIMADKVDCMQDIEIAESDVDYDDLEDDDDDDED